MKPVVVVESLTKIFSKNSQNHLSYGFKDLVNAVLGRKRDTDILRKDEFRAVDNVDFTLHQGESIALIGRNGCGKTTTLKMIAGLIRPDSGSVMIDGRIQALISLGTGFDKSLSGRDNVFNAAAILGLSKKETNGIFQDIVDFSEISDFIDSPVSTYSSGMYARLGFSVAVHLNPEIMLIDEILGVGDYAFQNKCYHKMNEMKSKGVTIVLVSHSHNRVMQMCERAIWLERGRVKTIGDSKSVVNQYLEFLDHAEIKNSQRVAAKKLAKEREAAVSQKNKNLIYGQKIYDERDRVDDIHMDLFSEAGETDVLELHAAVRIVYGFRLCHRVTKLETNIVFYRKSDGAHITKINSTNGSVFSGVNDGAVQVEIAINDLFLNPGEYVIVLAVFDGHAFLYRNVAKEFRIMSSSKITFPNSLIDFDCSQRKL